MLRAVMLRTVMLRTACVAVDNITEKRNLLAYDNRRRWRGDSLVQDAASVAAGLVLPPHDHHESRLFYLNSDAISLRVDRRSDDFLPHILHADNFHIVLPLF